MKLLPNTESSEVHFILPPTTQAWGGFMAMFSDVDGNVFSFDEISAALE